jgi:type VI secretion system protein ImpH
VSPPVGSPEWQSLALGDVVALGFAAGDVAPDEVVRHLEAARRRGAYPLLLVLERLLGGDAAIGTAANLDEERIRLRHDRQLVFRPAEVSGLRLRDVNRDLPVVEITTAFLGLTGASSPLPPYLVEEVAQEDEEAPLRRDFLDMFHHRFVSLFFRARARSDFANGYRSDQTDAWSRRVLALLGRDRPPRVEPWRVLRWSPILAQRNVTAAAVEVAVADVLSEEMGEVGVSVEPFVGAWVPLDPDDENRLGRARSLLGRDLVLGRRILDRASKFRLVLGPLGRDGLVRLSGNEKLLRRIADAVAELCAATLDFELVLWLTPEAAPHLELGTARLGRDSWLGRQAKETRLRVDIPARAPEG